MKYINYNNVGICLLYPIRNCSPMAEWLRQKAHDQGVISLSPDAAGGRVICIPGWTLEGTKSMVSLVLGLVPRQLKDPGQSGTSSGQWTVCFDLNIEGCICINWPPNP